MYLPLYLSRFPATNDGVLASPGRHEEFRAPLVRLAKIYPATVPAACLASSPANFSYSARGGAVGYQHRR